MESSKSLNPKPLSCEDKIVEAATHNAVVSDIPAVNHVREELERYQALGHKVSHIWSEELIHHAEKVATRCNISLKLDGFTIPLPELISTHPLDLLDDHTLEIFPPRVVNQDYRRFGASIVRLKRMAEKDESGLFTHLLYSLYGITVKIDPALNNKKVLAKYKKQARYVGKLTSSLERMFEKPKFKSIEKIIILLTQLEVITLNLIAGKFKTFRDVPRVLNIIEKQLHLKTQL